MIRNMKHKKGLAKKHAKGAFGMFPQDLKKELDFRMNKPQPMVEDTAKDQYIADKIIGEPFEKEVI